MRLTRLMAMVLGCVQMAEASAPTEQLQRFDDLMRAGLNSSASSTSSHAPLPPSFEEAIKLPTGTPEGEACLKLCKGVQQLAQTKAAQGGAIAQQLKVALEALSTAHALLSGTGSVMDALAQKPQQAPVAPSTPTPLASDKIYETYGPDPEMSQRYPKTAKFIAEALRASLQASHLEPGQLLDLYDRFATTIKPTDAYYTEFKKGIAFWTNYQRAEVLALMMEQVYGKLEGRQSPQLAHDTKIRLCDQTGVMDMVGDAAKNAPFFDKDIAMLYRAVYLSDQTGLLLQDESHLEKVRTRVAFMFKKPSMKAELNMQFHAVACMEFVLAAIHWLHAPR